MAHKKWTLHMVGDKFAERTSLFDLIISPGKAEVLFLYAKLSTTRYASSSIESAALKTVEEFNI